jgi:hypothetical protein
VAALKLRSVDNSFDGLLGIGDPASMGCGPPTRTGRIMAKRKKQSKALKRKTATARGKARKVSKAAKAAKRTVAKAKPKSAPVKKAARKVKPPVAPVVETVVETAAVEMIEQPAPVTVAEVEEIRKAS